MAQRMSRALERNGGFPPGSTAVPERRHAVIWKGRVPASWRRKPMTGARLKAMLAPMREKIEREIKRKAMQVMERKLAQKAATAWTKFVPVLNVIATAYDVYDIATTGYDLYKMVDKAMEELDGKVFEIRPDVSMMGPDGSLQDIYDFKFDGDSYGNNPGQEELYLAATGKKPKVIDQKTCRCK